MAVCPKDKLKDTEAQTKLDKLHEANENITGKKWWSVIYKAFFDDRVNIHRELDSLGADGKTIRIGLDNSAGGATEGIIETQVELEKLGISYLTKDETKTLSDNLLMRRILSLDEHRTSVAQEEIENENIGEVREVPTGFLTVDRSGNKKIFNTAEEAESFADALTRDIIFNSELLNPFGITPEHALDWRTKFKERMPDQFKALEELSDKYFAVFDKQLKKLKDSELISEDSYKKMKAVGDYMPRRYLKFIDPRDTYNSLEKLDKGSTGALLMNPAQLLKDYIVRLHDKIARNDANLKLYDFAKNNKDNKFVRIVSPTDRKMRDDVYVYAVVKGERKPMVFLGTNNSHSMELAQEWNGRDPIFNSAASDVIAFWSGSSILRASATGMNPGFALTNTPRDMFFSWFRTREFNSFAPVGFYQMGKMMLRTAKDVWNTDSIPTGYAKEFFDNRGALEFMTTQGQLFQERATGKSKIHLSPKLRALEKFMSFWGQRSELWVRVAVMQQAIKNGKSKEEAAWLARSYLDFAQGGTASKAVDKFIPYFNVGMISTRGIIETFKKDKTLAVWKTMQFSALFMGVMIHNMLKHSEKIQGQDDDDRAKYISFFLNWEKKVGGKTVYPFVKIPMDQGQAAIANIYTLFFSRLMGGLRNMTGEDYGLPDDFYNLRPEIAWRAIEPIIPFMSDMPPTVRAIYGSINNYDAYWNSPIWRGSDYGFFGRGAEFDGETGQLFKLLSEAGNALLPGDPLSPVRMRYLLSQYITPSNFFIKAADFGNEAVDAVSESEKDSVSEILLEAATKYSKIVPGASRLFEYTSGTNRDAQARSKAAGQAYEVEKSDEDRVFRSNLKQYNNSKPGSLRESQYLGASSIASDKYHTRYAREEAKRKIKQAMKIKKLFGSNRDDSDLWYELGQSKPDKAARRYFDTYIQADQVQRERLDRSLQQYDYINNKAFRSELADLWRNYSGKNK
tara:strand:- start:372 stop:3260 length:2889 start_codon:yes stop_codon:yes gene_type:complete